jgi:hypothetical protein
MERMFEIAVRFDSSVADELSKQLIEIIDSTRSECLQVSSIKGIASNFTPQGIARHLYDGIQAGWVLPRIEAVKFDDRVPDKPDLGPFRLACARRELPLVDIWHRPCSFPRQHYPLLCRMDGTRTREELADFARAACKDLAFEPWIQHLAGRGMLVSYA